MYEQTGQLGGKCLRVVEVAVGGTPRGDRVDDPRHHIAQRVFAPLGAEPATEILLGDDVRGVLRPELRELDAELLEDDLTGAVMDDAGIAALPWHLVTCCVFVCGALLIAFLSGRRRMPHIVPPWSHRVLIFPRVPPSLHGSALRCLPPRPVSCCSDRVNSARK